MNFSIIIPAYNYGRFLPRAIDSALQQDSEDFEVIVVDDGSKDETSSVLAGYGEKIIAHRQENAGVSVARNTGAKLAQGKFLLFFDADDELLPNALTHFRAAIASNPDVRLFISHHFSVNSEGQEKEAKPQLTLSDCESNFRDFLNRKFGIVHGAVLMRRDNFDTVSYPPGITNGEDLVLFGQSLALYPAASIPHATVKVHGHDDRARDNIDAIKSVGLKTVDLLFNPAILPTEMMIYRKEFLVRRQLSLGRSLLKSGDMKAARKAYWQAIQTKPSLLFEFTHLRRFLRTLLG